MKTTKEHFELFKSEVRKWVNIFDLNKYSIAFEWKELDPADARMIADEISCTATIALNKDVGFEGLNYDITFAEKIKELAKHESIHLLLWNFSEKAHLRFMDKDSLIEAEEAVVRKLTKIIHTNKKT